MKVVESWEDFFDGNEEETEYVTVTLGDKEVRLGSVSADDIVEFFERQNDEGTRPTNGLWLVARSLVNSKGERIGDLDELTRLRKKQPSVMKKLIEAASAINGLTPKAIEETKNDSQEGPIGISPTSSPEAPAA